MMKIDYDNHPAEDGTQTEYFIRYIHCDFSEQCWREAKHALMQAWPQHKAEDVVGHYCEEHIVVMMEWAKKYNHAYIALNSTSPCRHCGEVGQEIHTQPGRRVYK